MSKKNRWIIVIIILIISAYYLLFMNGANNIRSSYEERFTDKKSSVVDSYLGYIEDGNNSYDEQIELYDTEVNHIKLPIQDKYSYFIFGDLRNGNKLEAFINGNKLKNLYVTTDNSAKFWETIYLKGNYVIELPKLIEDKNYELILVSGNKTKKYLIKTQ